MARSSIPVIDVSPFFGGIEADKDAVGRRVADAFQSVGFMAVTGHGVPQETIDDALFPHFPSIVDIQCGEKAILL